MGEPLEPPTWPAVGALLTVAAFVYTLIFAAAVSASFSRRWYTSRLAHTPLLRPIRMLHEFMDSLLLYAFPLALLRICISTSVCVEYVYITYLGHIPISLRVINLVLGIFLLVHLLMLVVRAVNPVPFVLRLEAIMEALSLASLIFAGDRTWLNFSFLQAYTVLRRYFKVEPYLENMFLQKISPFRRQLARLTLQFTVFIYIFACGLQLFEVLGDPTESLTATTFELTLANSLYFTVVTIFTVGYGDFVPYTLFGRLWIIFIIVFGAYLVSREIGQVIDVVSGLRRGMGSFVKDEDEQHCVVCGNVKWEYLKTFLQEFYADNKNAQTKMVVISDKPNWTEVVWNNFFDSVNPYRHHVVYLEGSCLTRDDFERAQVEDAQAVFILNNQHGSDPYAEDSETLKRILTVRSFAPKLPVYSMCALRDSMLQITVALEQRDIPSSYSSVAVNSNGLGLYSARSFDGMPVRTSIGSLLGEELYAAGGQALSAAGTSLGLDSSFGMGQSRIRTAFAGDVTEDDDDDDYDGMLVKDGTDLKSEAICMQEVEMSLLAENVFCNGLSTLLSNLVLNVAPVTKLSDHPWMAEYKIGAECRFAHVKLPPSLLNMRFSEMALVLYDYGMLLIATKRFNEAKWRAITPDTVITLNSFGLIITFHSVHLIDKVMMHAADRLLRVRDDLAFAEDSSHGDPSALGDDSPGVDAVPLPGEAVYNHAKLARHASEPVSRPNRDITLSEDRAPAERQSGSGQTSVQPHQEPGAMDAGSVDRSRSNVMLSAATSRTPVSSTRAEQLEMDTEIRAGSLGEASASNAPQEQRLGLSAPGGASLLSRVADDLDFVADVVLQPGQEIVLDNSPAANDPRWKHVAESHSRSADLTTERRVLQKDGTSTADGSPMVGPGHERQHASVQEASVDSSTNGKETRLKTPGLVSRRSRGKEGSKVSFPVSVTEVPSRGTTGGNPEFSSRRINISSQPSQVDAANIRKVSKIFFGDSPLPVRLKGHIVVCVIGSMGLVNLRHFLRRVWVKRRGFKRETPVVAICPKITEAVEDDIAMFASNALYVIQGNSLSISTLKRAQYERARAIVVLACEDKNDIDSMDAKAIFTVMTLDYVLGESSNTFVCTMLDAEESMKLLRAPAHARRRGADLGRVGDEYARSLSLYLPKEATRQSVPPSPRTGQRSLRAQGNVPPSPGIAGQSTSANQSSVKSPQPLRTTFVGTAIDKALRRRPEDAQLGIVPQRANLWSTRSESIRDLVSDAVHEQQLEYGTFRENLGGSSYSLLAASRDSRLGTLLSGVNNSAVNMLFSSASFGPTPQTSSVVFGHGDEDRGSVLGKSMSIGNNLGTGGMQPYRALESSRSELFEKSRYASGEMMISSVLVALLIREFAMPGIMSVVRKIFGVGVGKDTRTMKKSWIRTHRVPRQWIESGKGGQRTYRELFEVLLTYKCFPLGLYRSGDVTVRVQVGDEHVSHGPSSQVPSNASEVPQEENIFEPEFNHHVLFSSTATPATGPHTATESAIMSAQAQVDTSGNFGESIGAEGIPLLARSVSMDGRSPVLQTYRCSTTGHVATFEEISGGENVLPYVYTNPEPYTLVSEHDAVYVLAHPHLRLPDEWKA